MKKVIQITKANQIIIIDQAGDYIVELVQPGAEVSISGRFLTSDQDQLEVAVLIHHQVSHTKANVSLKGAAQDRSRLVFKGKIVIDEGCGDTNSFLEERILLLSDQAKAEAVPELEIKCDDVKCSHAATISRINEDQLFYLQSRGIPREKAQDLVVKGFLEPQ